jgi:predicted alpha-1,2-mannosidase
MRNKQLSGLILCLTSTAVLSARDPVEWVDPLIGSSHDGQTYPAAGAPFGMTQWTPQTRDKETKCVSPYYFKDTRIQGFRGTHEWSGSCTQDYGSFTIMPETGPLKTGAEARSSAFRRDHEHASPWLYQVTLDDYGIDAEMTGSVRSGFLRFSFPASREASIVVQVNSKPGEGEIHVDKRAREIYGFNPVHRIYAGSGKPAGFNGYFVAKFSEAFTGGGNVNEAGQPIAYVKFGANQEHRIGVRVGTSFTSVEEARKNLESEIPDWNFEAARDRARAEWSRMLSKLEIRGASEQQQTIFYTALYHALLMPRTFSDVDGSYPGFAGEGKTETAKGFVYYDDFSLWDTFRALHPLLTILDPQRSQDMAQSLVAKGQQGGWIPIFPGWNSYTAEMIGDHDVEMIVDAYAKGIRGFDVEEAYRLMLQNATKTPPPALYADGRGRRALASYLQYGYIPLEDPVKDAFHTNEQVSRTLEYAYDDFVLAQLAKALGKTGDYQALMKRAENWRNVIDPKIGFARGRHADGSWAEPFDPGGKYKYVTEGLPFQYTFFVPHNIPGLIKLMGGAETFNRRLDEIFAKNYYEHGNEPSHHIAYLYDYAGEAWKTQDHVRQILTKEYGTGPDGLSGNDDCGQISAWYVLSAIGFYPVAPGVPVYEIGSPLFPEVVIHLADGKQTVITATGASDENRYIQSARVNGKSSTRTWISHAELIQGGHIEFQMGHTPNKSWGSKPQDFPPDLMGAAKPTAAIAR